MSDVLAFTRPHSLLLTGLTNPQVVRTAEMAELAAVCFVRGKVPEAETVSFAADEGIPLLRTRLPMFESCGRLHALGLAGCSEVVRTAVLEGPPVVRTAMLEGPPVSHRSAERARSVCERCGPNERSRREA